LPNKWRTRNSLTRADKKSGLYLPDVRPDGDHGKKWLKCCQIPRGAGPIEAAEEMMKDGR
jgi:hypothetical protein